MAEVRVFEAQYPGRCAGCGEDFRPGRRIKYVRSGGVVTEDCAEAEGAADPERSHYYDDDSSALLHEDRLPVAPPNSKHCNSCFLYHGPGQKECW